MILLFHFSKIQNRLIQQNQKFASQQQIREIFTKLVSKIIVKNVLFELEVLNLI